MNPRQLRALFRRHLVAVLVVIIVAACAAWDIKTTRPMYQESATIVFVGPGSDPYSSLGAQLIPLTNLMTSTMMSPEYLSKIRAAGGTATPDLSMVNLYNQQFPQFGVPYDTLSAEAPDPAAVARTFTIVVNTLRSLLSSRQAQAHVPRWGLASIRVVGDSGVQAPLGSRIRVLAGLAVLTLIALFMVVIFLDRRALAGLGVRRPFLPARVWDLHMPEGDYR